MVSDQDGLLVADDTKQFHKSVSQEDAIIIQADRTARNLVTKMELESRAYLFYYHIVRIWNNFLREVFNATNVNTFKNKLNKSGKMKRYYLCHNNYHYYYK